MDLHSAIAPIFIICKILAITPYSVHRTSAGYELVVTKRGLAICILQYTSLIVYYMYALYFEQVTLFQRDNALDMVTKVAQHYAIILLAISTLTFFHIHKKEIFDVLTGLTSIANELNRLNIVVEYRRVRRFCVIHVGIRLIMFGTIVILHAFGLKIGMTVTVMILYNIVVIVTSMQPSYVFALLFDISYKYSLINNKLQCMFNNPTSDIQLSRITVIRVSNARESDDIAVLKKLINIHGRLYDLCQTINAMYNVHFVIILLSCFIATVVAGYDIIRDSDDDHLTLVFLLNMSNWALYNIAHVLLVIQNLEACCSQANKTATVLNEIRYKKCSVELEERIMTSVMLLTHQKLEFTAYGLFTIDYNLLYTMIGAVSTYLIILYQFRSAI